MKDRNCFLMDQARTSSCFHAPIFILCIQALFFATSSAQNEVTDTISDLAEDIRFTKGGFSHPSYLYKLKDLFSTEQEKRLSEAAKRLNPASFSFTRGKKDMSFADSGSEMMDTPARRLSPSDFFGARGRRTPPDGFLGLRGKRFQQLLDDFDSDEVDTPSKRQPPKGFVAVRGKRQPPEGFIGSRGKKSPPFGFYGPRGKKYAPPSGFLGARGKKSPPRGFMGARGKKDELPEVIGNDNSVPLRALHSALLNRWPYLMNSQDSSSLEELFNKRQPSLGFHPMRG